MNKFVFVGIGIAVVIAILGYSLSIQEPSTNLTEIQEPTESSPAPSDEGKNIVIDVSDAMSAIESP